ncbi:MAG: hypothetical protein ACREEM_48415, partial [Blastocatellia bacterium]
MLYNIPCWKARVLYRRFLARALPSINTWPSTTIMGNSVAERFDLLGLSNLNLDKIRETDATASRRGV